MDLKSIERNGAIREAITEQIVNQVSEKAESDKSSQERFDLLWQRVQVIKENCEPPIVHGKFTEIFMARAQSFAYSDIAIEFTIEDQSSTKGGYRRIQAKPIYRREDLPVEAMDTRTIGDIVQSYSHAPELGAAILGKYLGKLEESAEAAEILLGIKVPEPVAAG